MTFNQEEVLEVTHWNEPLLDKSLMTFIQQYSFKSD